MCSTFSTSTANWITDMQFRSVCTITLAMLRWTNTSPGARPMTWFAGTRESEQPIHRYLGACSSDRRSKNCGSSLRTPSAQAWLLLRSFASACFMASILQAGEVHPAHEYPRQRCDPGDQEAAQHHCSEGRGESPRQPRLQEAEQVQRDQGQHRHQRERVAHDAHDAKQIQHGSPLHHSMPKLDAHVAGLGEESHCLEPALAAEAGLAHAAEGGAQVAHQPAVDPDDAGVYARREAVRAVEVPGPDRCGKAVVAGVGKRECL